jgi:hypothetical protein
MRRRPHASSPTRELPCFQVDKVGVTSAKPRRSSTAGHGRRVSPTRTPPTAICAGVATRLLNDLRRGPIPFVADFLHSLGYWTAREAASPKRRDNARHGHDRARLPAPREDFRSVAFGSWCTAWARDRLDVADRPVRRVVLPAHRSDRAFQHSANPDWLRADMKFVGAHMQCAL